MTSEILTQLQDFLSQPEVAIIYSSIRKLNNSKLLQALRMRNLSLDAADESILRTRLLRFEVEFYHPEIPIPAQHTDQNKLSKEDANNLQVSMQALCDMTKTLCAESNSQCHTDGIDNSKASAEKAGITNDSLMQLKYRLNSLKLLKAFNLQYSGEKGEVASEFLEKLECFRKFARMNDQTLLETLPCVFDNETCKWHRANNFNDWPSFKRKFAEVQALTTEKLAASHDRATQTDEKEKNLQPSVRISKTLEDLENCLYDIGLKMNTGLVKSQSTTTISSCSKSPDKRTCLENKCEEKELKFTNQISDQISNPHVDESETLDNREVDYTALESNSNTQGQMTYESTTSVASYTYDNSMTAQNVSQEILTTSEQVTHGLATTHLCPKDDQAPNRLE